MHGHTDGTSDNKSDPSFYNRSTSRSPAIHNCTARTNGRDLPLASTPSGAEYCVSLISCLARCNKYSLMWSVTTYLLNSRQERNAVTESDTKKHTALNGTDVQNITYRKIAHFCKIYIPHIISSLHGSLTSQPFTRSRFRHYVPVCPP